jgi:hypothetical protein
LTASQNCSSAVAVGAQVWRRVAGAVAAAASFSIGLNISWLGFGTSDQSFVMRYPWGLMHYSFVWLSSLWFASGGILNQG